MQVKLKLIYDNGIYIKGKFNIPKKDLDNMSLFGAIEKKVKCFSPKQILIL
jgi:hypothetical protein